MPEIEKEPLTEEEERERSEHERMEELKKQAEQIAIDLALKKARFRQMIDDIRLEKEIIALEKKWDRARMKYERSLKEVRRMEEEKPSSEAQKTKLSEIDRELDKLDKQNRQIEAERETSAEAAVNEKDVPEKEVPEKDAPEKDRQKEKKKTSILEPVQKRIGEILARKKPSDEKNLANMKDELKAAMADLIAKRVAFIDPNDPRENFIRGDKKNEEHYREAYDKLMSGGNRAFDRTIDEMSSYEDMKRIGTLALTNKAGGLMLYMGDQMKKDDIQMEARADKNKEKVLTVDKEMVLKPQDQ